MKKILAISLTLAILSLSLFSCGSQKPEDVAVDFLEALISLDFNKAKKYVSDVEDVIEEQNDASKAKGIYSYVQEILHENTSLKVIDTTYTADKEKVAVTVKITSPDLSEFANEFTKKLLASALNLSLNDINNILTSESEEYSDEIKAMAKDVLNGVDKTSRLVIVDLEKENGKWLVEDWYL